jgi:hypothetical protein
MNNIPESEIIALLKKKLKDKNLSTSCVREYYCADQGEYEKLKSDIKNQVNNNCRFFSKEVDGSIHVIAFVNIELKKLGDVSVKGFSESTGSSISNLFTKSKSLSKLAFFDNSFNPANINTKPAAKNTDTISNPATVSKPGTSSIKPAARIEGKNKNPEK